MAATQQIKRRIGSVKNTRQITKAMQLVSSSKLRRAQQAAELPRQYASLAFELLTHLRRQVGLRNYDLFVGRPIKTHLIIVVSSDRGLAGAYNANLAKQLVIEATKHKTSGATTKVIAIGRHIASFASRLDNCEVLGVYNSLPAGHGAEHLRPIITSILEAFRRQAIDAADVMYTRFNSTISQQVQVQRLLPAGFKDAPVSEDIGQATFEPSQEAVLTHSIVRLIEAQLLQAALESAASEHAMRMVAMKNATDNATDIIDDLTLAYNNVRQATITQEIAEITSGVEALR